MVENVNVVKMLGMYIDSKLSFKEHITEICKRAGRKLNVLRRLSAHLDTESKLVLFYSFVLAHFEYCSTIWHCCNRKQARKIEKIQERALRYVYKDLTARYHVLMTRGEHPLIYTHRVRSIMIAMLNVFNGASPK